MRLRPNQLLVAILFFVGIALSGNIAWARVERFAVVIGNNRGAPGETELRYAEAEASRMKDVLRELGGFTAANVVLLQGESAESVRRTLITVNERIRAASPPESESELIVYYSGHSDANALHLGTTLLDLQEIEALVRGSAAKLRMLIVDGCRSGALTRQKGARQVAPFAIRMGERLEGQGVVFLSSAAVNEDAQESDALQGSFFTHALISGLRGAADANRDGTVVLEEAYRYAYETTLRLTSESFAGPQHPNFRFDFHGQGNVVLTQLAGNAAERAALAFPPERSYLVFSESGTGAVAAEVGPHDESRTLTLKPGRYAIRGRTAAYLLEGDVTARAGETVFVGDDQLKRVEYARLIRKGGSDARVAQGPQGGYRFHTKLANATSACLGAYVGYSLEYSQVSFVPRIGWCRSTFSNETLSAHNDEFDGMLRAVRSFDLPFVTVGVGLGVGVAVVHQGFTTPGLSPSRTMAAFEAAASVGVTRDLPGGFYVTVDAEGLMAIFSLVNTDGVAATTTTSFAIRPSLGLGKQF